MLYVVVQLLEPKQRIIIPENFIFDLCEQSLKNVGRNSNHRYLIYWSKNAIADGTNVPDINVEPNFGLPLSKVYPPENGLNESCYIAQLKYFYSEYKQTENIMRSCKMKQFS